MPVRPIQLVKTVTPPLIIQSLFPWPWSHAFGSVSIRRWSSYEAQLQCGRRAAPLQNGVCKESVAEPCPALCHHLRAMELGTRCEPDSWYTSTYDARDNACVHVAPSSRGFIKTVTVDSIGSHRRDESALLARSICCECLYNVCIRPGATLVRTTFHSVAVRRLRLC